ncbi:TadG family pilus assembly protein [Brevundimonas sp.]|uniref:TadG family pilus assembly protein n=1 Tax=Brevundimonas sp. TaxID=1871086 RepID=UPI003AF876D8
MNARDLAVDERGGVAVMAALAAGLMCVMAVAIEVGSVAFEGRRLQGAADLAALSAAADLARADDSARAAVAANSPEVSSILTEPGVFVADPGVAPGARFQAGGAAPNAVRVTLTKEVPLYFGALLMGRPSLSMTRSASALTTTRPRAAFSLGSRLASLDGGVANALLGGLTGSTVSLSVADYEALARSDVDLLQWWGALASERGVNPDDHDAVLQGRIDAGRLTTVTSTLVDASARPALASLARALNGRRLQLSDMIAIEPGGERLMSAGLTAKVSALDMVMAMATLSQGDQQTRLKLASGAGLASLEVDLAIGSPPRHSAWLTVTRDGSPVIRTRQARLWIRAVTSDKMAGLARVNLPILVDLAPAEARLKDIDCASGVVRIEARPGLAHASIGDIDASRLGDFGQDLSARRAVLVDVPGIASITGYSNVAVTQSGWRTLAFTEADIDARTVRSASTTTIAESAISSALGQLETEVRVSGLRLGLGGLERQLAQLLAPLGRSLDGVINSVLTMLGVRVGVADVRVNGMECTRGGPQLIG